MAENGSPLISFLIPTYNGERTIESCVQSVLDAGEKAPCDMEIVICDDASTDGTAAVLEKLAGAHGEIRIVRHEKNRGICGARNSCLRAARGEWVCYMDHDDLMDLYGLRVILDTAEEGIDQICYGYQEFQEKESPGQGDGRVRSERECSGEEIEKLQWDCLCRYKDNVPLVEMNYTPWGKIYRREFLIRNHLEYDEKLLHNEDIIFNLIFLALHPRVKICEYPLYKYRIMQSSYGHRCRPEIVKETLYALEVLRNCLDRYYPGNARMEEMYRFRILWGLIYCVARGPGNAAYPGKYAKSRKDFKELLGLPLFAGCLRPEMVRRLSLPYRTLAVLTGWKWLLMIKIMSRAEMLLHKLKLM